jgi:AcrR family transcriptional regulator
MTEPRLKPSAGRPRADAERNRSHLLYIAQLVITEQGTNASLRDIARRAGVGLGTFYRNFPTRDALLENLLRDGFDRLHDQARSLEKSAEPLEALQAWLKEFVRDATTYRGLSSSLMATMSDETSELHASCLRMRNAGGRLLKRAQAAGVIRNDVDSSDVFALTNAVAWIAEQSPAFAKRKDHLFSLIMDAVRTPPASSTTKRGRKSV